MKVSLLLDGQAPKPHAGLVKMRYTERIGELWQAVIWVINPRGALDPQKWVGHNLTVKIFNAQENVAERLDGVVVGFGAEQEDARGIIYRVELRPRVWKLWMNVRSRVFTNITAPKLIDDLLREGGLTPGRHYSIKLSNSAAYPVHEQLVQYEMSDWEFLHILAVTNGLVSFFHSPNPQADPEQFVITDDRSFFPAVKPDLAFAIGAGMPTDAWAVRSFFTGGELVPEKIKVSFTDPSKVHTLYTKSKSLSGQKLGEFSVFLGSGTQKWLDHVVKVGAQELGRLGRWARVASTDPLLRAGRVFSMNPNPENVSGSFLVVEARHYMRQEADYALSGDKWDVLYEGDLLAVPSTVDWRGQWLGAWGEGLRALEAGGAGYGA